VPTPNCPSAAGANARRKLRSRGRQTPDSDVFIEGSNAAVEAFVVIEADGRIVGWNRVAEAMFGWTREQAVGADMGELLLPDGLRAGYRADLSRFVAGGVDRLTGGHIELAAVDRSGREVPRRSCTAGSCPRW